ncbi:tRNA lysidine(34) synthetase TilS [Aquihabitans daechungensis]|uniref:tRNA lysidine(34) synthetase TilS n=1 Tax=Aquihabitans daechungensis TaxID=1052257 RepID=UPI003BA29D72
MGELVRRCTFPPAGTEVACAVSGGADSLALLALAAAAGCRATAVHVDHGLRPGSAAEAEVVADAADRLGAGFRSEQVAVGDGPNLEARARAARFAVLPTGVLTGHTADDRAETVLLHLIRGAGPTGAVGMARSATRPLLDLRRTDTVALCEALGFDPVRDPSNDDPRFRRNRVRHELLPLLASIGERDPVPVLVRQADLFADVDAALGLAAAQLDPSVAADLAGAPVAVAGAAVRAWLVDAGVGGGYGVDAATVARVLDVARGGCVATEVAGGWRVARSKGRLSVQGPAPWQDAAHD